MASSLPSFVLALCTCHKLGSATCTFCDSHPPSVAASFLRRFRPEAVMTLARCQLPGPGPRLCQLLRYEYHLSRPHLRHPRRLRRLRPRPLAHPHSRSRSHRPFNQVQFFDLSSLFSSLGSRTPLRQPCSRRLRKLSAGCTHGGGFHNLAERRNRKGRG